MALQYTSQPWHSWANWQLRQWQSHNSRIVHCKTEAGILGACFPPTTYSLGIILGQGWSHIIQVCRTCWTSSGASQPNQGDSTLIDAHIVTHQVSWWETNMGFYQPMGFRSRQCQWQQVQQQYDPYSQICSGLHHWLHYCCEIHSYGSQTHSSC